jgi:hypothetical protein
MWPGRGPFERLRTAIVVSLLLVVCTTFPSSVQADDPTLTASPNPVLARAPVTAAWTNVAAPTGRDWFGLYHPGDPDASVLLWRYVSCTTAPTTSAASAGSCVVPAPATVGTYELRLFANNSYVRLVTSAPFAVADPGTTLSAGTDPAYTGAPLNVGWANVAAPTARDWFGLYRPGDPDATHLLWRYANCTAAPTGPAAPAGSCTVPAPLTAGTYQLRLFANNSYTRLATSAPFAVVDPGTTLAASPNPVLARAPVTAAWTNVAAPTARDWVGLYRPGDPDTASVLWRYINCTTAPTVPTASAASAGACAIPAPTTPGTYELRLFANNSYARLATSAPLTVADPGTTPTVSPTPSATPTHTPTPTPSGTATPTASPTGTPTETPVDTATPPNTFTETPTPTATQTLTLTPTSTATSTPTVTPTVTPTTPSALDHYGCPVAAPGGGGCSFWDDATVPTITEPERDGSSVNVGMKFRSEVAGVATGVRFYKLPGNTGNVSAHIYDADTRIPVGSAFYTAGTDEGWKQVNFATPVPLVAGKNYVVSYFAPNGNYAITWDYFTNALAKRPLTALADGDLSGGRNSVYFYAPHAAFPWEPDGRATNYWVDVVFRTDHPDTVAPRVTGRAPAPSATATDPSGTIAVSFDERMRADAFGLTLNGSPVPLLSYDDAARTATFKPAAPLTPFTAYSAQLTQAADRAGNQVPAADKGAWSFTTGGPTALTPGELVLTRTFNAVGVEWFFSGDGDGDATATVAYKRPTDADWQAGLPLWRTAGPGADGRAFYGSVLFLAPDTDYEVRVSATDPDGVVGGAPVTKTIRTRADAVAPAGSLTPTRYVRATGSDGADGLTEATAWRTLERAVHNVTGAPSGAVVQVGPGYYAAPSSARALPLTLVAQFPAVDDAGAAINAGQRSVIEAGAATSPGSTWTPVTLTGPGLGGAPIGDTYTLWRWAGAGSGTGFLGYADTRAGQPTRVAKWDHKGAEVPMPARWAETLYTNKTYNYGWALFGSDIYARLPGDRDPNTLYMTAGGAAGLQVTGPDVRISGFELRPASSGVSFFGGAAQRGVVDHNLIVVGFAGVLFEANKNVTPHQYGRDHVVQHNRILDSSLWTEDHVGSPAIPWNFIKGGVYNPDGSLYGERIGESNESNGVRSRGGAWRVVIRRNTIDGPFNGIGAYNADFDRYATQDQDIHDNVLRRIADDAFEPEQVAINWRLWRNRVEHSAVFLSTGPVAYGPVYVVRNTVWRISRDGVGRDGLGRPGVSSLFFKYSRSSSPAALLYVLHNTFWSDSADEVDGANDFAGGSSTPEQFYLRNNIVRATRYAFRVSTWNETANSFSTTDVSRGLAVHGQGWTADDVDAYRAAHLAATGQTTTTNVGGHDFVTPPDALLSNPTAGDLTLAPGSPFVDGGVVVPNVSEPFTGDAPDLGATER